MFRPLDILLRKVISTGNIVFVDHTGTPHRYGDGAGPEIMVTLRQLKTEIGLCLDPELAAGEAYMEGTLQIDKGDTYTFVELMMQNLQGHSYPAWSKFLERIRQLALRFAPTNLPQRSRENVRHHYDIDSRLYDLFLDPDRQYSCAYFTPGAELTEAQIAKKRHIMSKLALAPGMSVLDIGSGWGGLALYLARAEKVKVTGITLSGEQLIASRERAHAEGMEDRVAFELQDYREVEPAYDRIVSVGMFEHVGRDQQAVYFRTLARLLADDGVALIHTIGRSDGPAPTHGFIARHIFPGGHLPSLSEIVRAVEESGLVLTDVEVLRLHYAQTLRAWRERFQARRQEAVAIMGERFCRMWEFYLAGSEAAFRYQRLVVFQLQLEKRLGTLPTTRDYMYEAERIQKIRDGQWRRSLRIAGE